MQLNETPQPFMIIASVILVVQIQSNTYRTAYSSSIVMTKRTFEPQAWDIGINVQPAKESLFVML